MTHKLFSSLSFVALFFTLTHCGNPDAGGSGDASLDGSDSSVAHEETLCDCGSCQFLRCSQGFADCDDDLSNGCETALSTDRNSCGSCGAVCNGGAACVLGACNFTCAFGYTRVGDVCVNDVHRPIAPQSLSDVTLLRPTLRWRSSPNYDSAIVDLCRDRGCTSIIETLRTAETSARPSADLPPGSVVFWRIRGTQAGRVSPTTSATWLFHVPVRDGSSHVDTSDNAHLDVNGDGFDDVLSNVRPERPRVTAWLPGLWVIHGNRAGTVLPAQVIELPPTPSTPNWDTVNLGDVNGDGFADVAVFIEGMRPLYFAGGPAVLTEQGWPQAWAMAPRNFSVGRLGDINQDGYSDITMGPEVMSIGYGSTLGPQLAPGLALPGTVTAGGDFNGDGYSDVLHRNELHFGGPMGFRMPPDRLLIVAPGASDSSPGPVAVGDLNGDGLTDIAGVKWFRANNVQADRTTVSVFYGTQSQMEQVQAETSFAVSTTQIAYPAASTPLALPTFSDVNGDGYDDLIVARRQLPMEVPRIFFDALHAFHGGPMGLSDVVQRSFVNGYDRPGAASIGDFNGDGFDDFAVTQSGIKIYFGGPMGLPQAPSVQGPNRPPTGSSPDGTIARNGHPLTTPRGQLVGRSRST